jgi:hypothetical protein
VRTFEGAGHLEVYGGMQLPPDSCPAEATDEPGSGTAPDEPTKVDCFGDPENPLCIL